MTRKDPTDFNAIHDSRSMQGEPESDTHEEMAASDTPATEATEPYFTELSRNGPLPGFSQPRELSSHGGKALGAHGEWRAA
jgi:hypothetical protein